MRKSKPETSFNGSTEEKPMNSKRKIDQTIVSSNNVQEDSMNVAEAIREPSTFNQAWETRRQFEPVSSTPSLNLSKEFILTSSPRPYFEYLLRSGLVRLSNHTHATRERGIPLVFADRVQLKQMGRAFAMLEHDIHRIFYIATSAVERHIGLIDLKGDHSRYLVETVRPDGYINYECFYARILRDFDGRANLQAGKPNPMQQSLYDEVSSYNQWVNMFNGVVRMQVGAPLDADQERAVETATEEQKQGVMVGLVPNDDPNIFVRNNSRRHILYESVVNKYALESFVALAQELPAFELYSRAETEDSTIGFLEKLVAPKSAMEYGYQSQLAMLSGVELFPKA